LGGEKEKKQRTRKVRITAFRFSLLKAPSIYTFQASSGRRTGEPRVLAHDELWQGHQFFARATNPTIPLDRVV